MDKVNVLYCFDSETWRMAAVSMESLLANSNPTTPITIYCMVTPGTKGHGKIKRIVKSHKTGAKLIWREIKPQETPFGSQAYSKWPAATFYRLVPYRFFKDVDKLLYLSVNTLVYRDLSELFRMDISDYAMGAVYDMAQINDPSNTLGKNVKAFSEKYLNGGPYYNSGVLLLNPKKMAECEQSFFATNIPLSFPEQDLLNVAFAGKIKTLPLKYNLAPGIGVPSHFSKEEADEINAGCHVIVDCYYNKAYDKTHSNKIVFDLFEKCSKNIGMSPEMFENEDKKKEPIKKTFVPFIKVRGQTVLFFGMEIK